MSGHAKVGGAWKTVSAVSTKVGGVWKTVSAGYTRIGGVWKQWYSSAAPAAMEHIQTVNLAATATSITFSSILQDYKHLQIRYVAKTSTTRNRLWIRMNGVTTASYANHQLNGNGSVVASTNNTAGTKIVVDNGIAAATASIFNGGVIDILDYKSTTNNKTVRSLSGVVGADSNNQNRIHLTSGLFIGTTAITSLTFAPDADSFAIGTRFSLYGIKG